MTAGILHPGTSVDLAKNFIRVTWSHPQLCSFPNHYHKLIYSTIMIAYCVQ